LKKFKGAKGLWSLLKGITLWVLWIEINDLIFNGEWQHAQKIHFYLEKFI
jgi:hypothetical protein